MAPFTVLLESGQLTPIVARTFPRREVPAAIRCPKKRGLQDESSSRGNAESGSSGRCSMRSGGMLDPFHEPVPANVDSRRPTPDAVSLADGSLLIRY